MPSGNKPVPPSNPPRKPGESYAPRTWDFDVLQAHCISIGECTDCPGLIGIDYHTQDGKVFAHAHFAPDVASDLVDSLLAAIERMVATKGTEH